MTKAEAIIFAFLILIAAFLVWKLGQEQRRGERRRRERAEDFDLAGTSMKFRRLP